MSNKSTNIRVGADTSGIATAVQEITGSLRSLTSEIRNINKEAQVATEPIKKTFNNVKDTSGTAGASIMAFTGIVSDANYGIRGIANNLQFFTASMVTLIGQSNGLKGAFTALRASLMGPMGFLLLMTTGIALLERWGMTSKKATDETANFQKELSKQNAEAAIAFNNLTLMVQSHEDANKIKQAAKEINDKYNTTLNTEKVTVEGINAAYQLVLTSIKQKIQLQAVEDSLTKAIQGEALAEKSISKTIEERLKVRKELARYEGRSTMTEGEQEKQNILIEKEAALTEKLNLLQANKSGHLANQNLLLENANKLQDKILTKQQTDSSASSSVTKGVFTPMVMQAKTDLSLFQGYLTETIAAANKLPDSLAPIVQTVSEKFTKPIIDEFSILKERINSAIESFVEVSIAGLLGSLGEELGGSTKAFDEWGKNFIASFGEFLQKMGTMIMTYGIAMQAFKNGFLEPWQAVAAGAALIVIGGAVKGLHNKKFGGSSGGNVPVSGYTGSSGGSYGRGGDIEIYSRIDGRDIIMSSNRTSYAVRR